MEHTPNGGMIIVPLSPKTFVSGVETGIAYQARLQAGDWFNYPTPKEYQYKDGSYDSNSCCTFAALNTIEMQVNWFVKNGLIPADKLKFLKDNGYFDEQGFFNCSDWFTAVMSGTKPTGNDFESVWNAIRKFGLLPQSKGYAPKDFATIDQWLDPRNVTTEQKTEALKFLEIFDVAYEMVVNGVSNPDVIAYHLKQAPLHLATAVCAGWATDPVIKTCHQVVQHATAANGSEKNVATLIFDQYDPFNKKLAWDYEIPWALKGVITLKAPKPAILKPKYVFTRTMQKGSTGHEVEMLQRALKSLGFYKLDHFTEYFGQWTEDAVKAFQAYYAKDILAPIGLTLPTGKFASMSIKKMNALLNA